MLVLGLELVLIHLNLRIVLQTFLDIGGTISLKQAQKVLCHFRLANECSQVSHFLFFAFLTDFEGLLIG